jgi:PHD/YefM family antitoxin component YafN of YafNO toxin-antitoxin module
LLSTEANRRTAYLLSTEANRRNLLEGLEELKQSEKYI